MGKYRILDENLWGLKGSPPTNLLGLEAVGSSDHPLIIDQTAPTLHVAGAGGEGPHVHNPRPLALGGGIAIHDTPHESVRTTTSWAQAWNEIKSEC